jgi:Family of unknown function (DUF5399)
MGNMGFMVEIYSYEVTAHERFARDQQEVEAFRKQYHLPPSRAGVVAVQTKILDFVPKHPAVVLLMQTYQRKMWARFSIPKNYYLQRFASSYVAPSLGSSERQDADVHKLEAYMKRKTRGRFDRKKRDQEKEEGNQQRGSSSEEEVIEEGEALIRLLENGVKETNEMIDYVIARMHQFVQA